MSWKMWLKVLQLWSLKQNDPSTIVFRNLTHRVHSMLTVYVEACYGTARQSQTWLCGDIYVIGVVRIRRNVFPTGLTVKETI